MKVMAHFVLFALIAGAGSASGVETGLRPSTAEMMRLPSYCQARYTLQQGSPGWRDWEAQIGQNFIDIHHYCAGLNYVFRYWGARSKQEKSFYLERAMAGFNYLVKAQKPGFPLRAEMYANRGEVYKLMGRVGEATRDFEQAVAIDPRMAKPYLHLADVHVAAKSQKRALEVVTDGLRHVPDSTALQRRYLELGGQKPFPDPVVAKAPEPVMAPSEADEPAARPVEAASVEGAPEATPSPPKIGTPKNPYCRFCPPE